MLLQLILPLTRRRLATIVGVNCNLFCFKSLSENQKKNFIAPFSSSAAAVSAMMKCYHISLCRIATAVSVATLSGNLPGRRHTLYPIFASSCKRSVCCLSRPMHPPGSSGSAAVSRWQRQVTNEELGSLLQMGCCCRCSLIRERVQGWWSWLCITSCPPQSSHLSGAYSPSTAHQMHSAAFCRRAIISGKRLPSLYKTEPFFS